MITLDQLASQTIKKPLQNPKHNEYGARTIWANNKIY